MKLGRPTFVPVQDLEMGFEKMVKIAHARGGIKLISKSHIYLLISSSYSIESHILQYVRGRM